jgi:hypothetical protein
MVARTPRWTFHFTPTSASWLNAVEGFFATLAKRRLKRGVFRSVADLQATINRFLDNHNPHSKPFEWVQTRASSVRFDPLDRSRALMVAAAALFLALAALQYDYKLLAKLRSSALART